MVNKMWYKRKVSVVNKLLVNKVEKKVENKRVHIFYKEKRFFFCKFAGEYKVIIKL